MRIVTEFNKNTPHPVIALITEWMGVDGLRKQRDEDTELGGTMRLGGQECRLVEDSLASAIYGQESIVERHRHRYEFNNKYKAELEQAGMAVFRCLS